MKLVRIIEVVKSHEVSWFY